MEIRDLISFALVVISTAIALLNILVPKFKKVFYPVFAGDVLINILWTVYLDEIVMMILYGIVLILTIISAVIERRNQ